VYQSRDHSDGHNRGRGQRVPYNSRRRRSEARARLWRERLSSRYPNFYFPVLAREVKDEK